MAIIIQPDSVANVLVRLFRSQSGSHGCVHVDLQHQHSIFLQIGVVQVSQKIDAAVLRIEDAAGPQRFPGLRRALNGVAGKPFGVLPGLGGEMQFFLRAGANEQGAQAPRLPAVLPFQIAPDAVAIVGIGNLSTVVTLDGAAQLPVVDRVPGQRKHGIHAGLEQRLRILRAGQQRLLRFFPEKREKRGADESAQHGGGQQPAAQNHEDQRYF